MPLMRKPDSVVRSAGLHRHDQVDQTNALTSAFAHKEARRSVPTRRPILVVGQAHRECAGLRFQDAPTVWLASGFA
jgi:hypothetical protein